MAFGNSTLEALDLNGDGVSDVYLHIYPPQTGQTFLLSEDTDGDSYTNEKEAAFGTDWRDSNSKPTASVVENGPDLDVSFFGVSGVSYQVLNSPDLEMQWSPVSPILVGAGQTITVPVVMGGLTKNFWRLATGSDLDEDGDYLTAYEEGLLNALDNNHDSDGDGNSDTQEFQQGTAADDPMSFYLPTIVKTAGDNQAGAPSSIAGVPLTVEVTDSGGTPLFYVPITYSTTGGGFLITDRDTPNPTEEVTVYSDELGQAGLWFKFPPTEPISTQVTAKVRAGTQFNSVSFATASVAPPSNDMFALARNLNGETLPYQQTTAGSTLEASEPVHADTLEGASVWFTWTAPSTERVAFRTDGSDFDTVLAVYTGPTVDNLTEVASNDDQTEIDPLPFASKVVFQAEQGTTYRIAVAGFRGATGNLTITTEGSTGPANDFFADAQVLLSNSGTVTVSALGASVEANEPPLNGEVHRGTLWYKFPSTERGPLDISASQPSADTVVAVFTGSSVASLTPVAASTRAASEGGSLRLVTADDTDYWIAVASLSPNGGDISLSWGFEKLNDNFAEALVITGTSGTISGTNEGATTEQDEPYHWWYPYASIWYTWVAPSTGVFTFDTIGSSVNTVLAVYVGTELNQLQMQNADDNSGPDGAAVLQFWAEQGTEYKIAIDTYEPDQGATVLNWAPGEWFFSQQSTAQSSAPILTPEQRTLEGAQQDGVLFPNSGSFSALSETCPDPEEPNKGEVVHYNSSGEKVTSRTVYLSLPKPKPSDPTPQTCPQDIAIQHKIVTTNTPRTRDLPGMLKITLKSGDASVVEIKRNGATYTLDTQIPVLETGHSGCGVHDWHYGYENFEFIGKTKGEAVFEVECDPDPDDGGDGSATTKLTLTVKVFELSFEADPLSQIPVAAGSEWTGADGYSLQANSSKQKITAKTDPADVADLIELEVKEFKDQPNPDYQPADPGSVEKTSSGVFEYTAFKESKDAKAPRDKKVVVVAKIDESELCVKHEVTVKPVFNWLTTLHQHGPGEQSHGPEVSDFETAWRFARWKYGISTANLSSITYTQNGPGDAQVLYQSGTVGARPCIIYQSAFGTENYCASVLGHENVHGGQSVGYWILSGASKLSGAFNKKIEYPAYKWQVDNAARCGLSPGEEGQVTNNMNLTKQGKDPF